MININKSKNIKWINELITKFWDYQSLTLEKYFTTMHGKKIIDFFDNFIERDSHILDYACGKGAVTKKSLLESGLLLYYFKNTINKFFRKILPNLIFIAQKQ